MYKVNLIICSLFSFILSTGCMSAGKKSHAKEEIKEAIYQTREDWTERRNTFISNSETRVEDIKNDLSSMKKESYKLRKSNREKATEKVESAQNTLNSVREELANLKEASPDDWQSEKNSFLSIMNELEAKFSEARSYYK